MITLKELRTIIQDDLDIQDEKFITASEVDRAINKAVRDATIRIMGIYEDYFLDYDYLPLDRDIWQYDLPVNIFANKIRRLIYTSDFDNGDRYVIKRLKNVNSSVIAHEFTDYSYMLINDRYKGVYIHLYPAGQEKSKFKQIVDLAKHIQENVNYHFMDTAAHTTNPDTDNYIDFGDINSKYDLIELTNMLTNSFHYHMLDALKSHSWRYHQGLDTTSDDLPNITTITSYEEVLPRLTTIYEYYNLHISDGNAHGVVDDYPLTAGVELKPAGDIMIYYTRRPKVLVNDNDILDMIEFEDYIISKAKLYLLSKDFGNPVIDKVMSETKELEDMMLHILSDRVNDDDTSKLQIREDPYNGGIY